MRIGYTEEQEALRQELRRYYAEMLTPDVEADLATSSGIGPTVRRLVRQMAADGWLGIGWPTQYGGQGRAAMPFAWYRSMRPCRNMCWRKCGRCLW